MSIESNYEIAISMLTDWLEKTSRQVFNPAMIIKATTDRNLYARFFPSFEQITGNC